MNTLQLYSPAQAAEVLSLSRQHVYNLISRGELRAVKIGRATRITADELERYVERLCIASTY